LVINANGHPVETFLKRFVQPLTKFKMKQFIPHLRLLLLFFVITTSCSDEPPSIQSRSDGSLNHYILDARKAHEDIVANLAKDHPSEGRVNVSIRGQLVKTALWDRARVVSLSVGPAVVVPLIFDSSMYAEVPESGWKIAINEATYLMVYKGSDQTMHSEIVTTLPDKAYVESTTRDVFTGTSVIEDWRGNFIKGYRYTSNGFSRISRNTQSSTGKVACVITDWYNCVTVLGQTDCRW
jgi:hypothetical protein